MIVLLTNMDMSTGVPLRTHFLARLLSRRLGGGFVLAHGGEQGGEGELHKWGISPRQVIPLGLKGWKIIQPAHIWQQLEAKLGSRIDLCIAHGPWAGCAALSGRKQGLINMVIYEDLDLFPCFYSLGVRIAMGIIRLEKRILTEADRVISVSPELASRRQQDLHISPWVVENGVDVAPYQNAPDKREVFTLVYSGSITSWAGLDMALLVVAEVLRKGLDIELLIAGEGNQRPKLERLARRLGIDAQTKFLGFVPAEQLPSLLLRCHCGWAAFTPEPLMGYASPLKVWEYMAAGIPQLAVNYGYTGRVVSETGAGCVARYDKETLAQGLAELITSPELCRRYGDQGKKHAEGNDWHELLRRLWSRLAGECLP